MDFAQGSLLAWAWNWLQIMTCNELRVDISFLAFSMHKQSMLFGAGPNTTHDDRWPKRCASDVASERHVMDHSRQILLCVFSMFV